MLVDGAGQLKMTKDGKVLLSEMQIQVRFVPGSELDEVAAHASLLHYRTLPLLSLPEQQSLRMR
jgi:hypothetical protein